jgi:ribonuclease D
MNDGGEKDKRRGAAMRWGKSTTRPQELYPGLLEDRRLLNTFDDDMDASHPYETEIYNWCLTSKMLKDVSSPKTYKTISVVDPETLVNAAKSLCNEVEMSVSVKTSENSYLGMICVLQIATASTVYLVDALKLHNKIGPAMQRVFRNPYIVKYFFHGKDVPILQRDFAIFPVGVVLAQEVYSCLYPEKNYVTKSELLSTLCSYEYDPLIECADFCHRPIHIDLGRTLAEEVWHLHRSRLGLKAELKETLMMAELERSKCSNLIVYTRQCSLDIRELFESTLEFLSPYVRSSFDTKKQFEQVMTWREEICQKEDFNPEHFLSLEKVGQIVRALPKKKESLLTLYSPISSWEEAQVSSLLGIFNVPSDEPKDQTQPPSVVKSNRYASSKEVPRDDQRQQKRSVRQIHGRIDGNKSLWPQRKRKNRGRKEKQRSAARALMHRIYKQGL